jgi:hypothetical protein
MEYTEILKEGIKERVRQFNGDPEEIIEVLNELFALDNELIIEIDNDNRLF